jgi:hypothetical protein
MCQDIEGTVYCSVLLAGGDRVEMSVRALARWSVCMSRVSRPPTESLNDLAGHVFKIQF